VAVLKPLFGLRTAASEPAVPMRASSQPVG
jgi:hypothetical protein